VGIKGNETVNKAAKEALNRELVKSDWSKWVKRKSWQVRQDEWKSSGNLIATFEPNIRRYSSTEGLPRGMGYTNITHAHRLSDDPKP
jgi:hypothetical protein